MRQTTKHGTRHANSPQRGKDCGTLSLNLKRDIHPILINRRMDDRLTSCGRSPLELRQCILFQEFADKPIRLWTTFEVGAYQVSRDPHSIYNTSFLSERIRIHTTLEARIKSPNAKMQNLCPHGFNLQKTR